MPTVNELDARAEEHLYLALRRYWHPVLYASELEDQPRAATLLGEPLVLARLGGEPVAFRDLCIHRGSALSLGSVKGGNLVCRYHGWEYDQTGACVRIPARPGSPIPSRARATRYDVVEHIGLLWVCLDGPARLPLPEFPEHFDAAYRTVAIPSYEWNCGAARRLENFVDVSHLPFVHEGVLGDPERPEVAPYEVARTDHSLLFQSGLEYQPANPYKLDTGDADLVARDPIDYRIDMPFSVHLTQSLPDGKTYVLFMSGSPVDAKRTRTFSFLSRNYELDPERDQMYVASQTDVVLEQDRPVVESQRPEELPLDFAAELHGGAADRASIFYRRWLVEIAAEFESDDNPLHHD
jgi:vanillate O-demethylase monooxygenase subunit